MTAATKLPVLQRPRTRGECVDVPRPCPFVECRYNLKHDDVGNRSRSGPKGVRRKVTDEQVATAQQMRDGGAKLMEIGRTLGYEGTGSASRVRQILIAAGSIGRAEPRYSCALDAADDGPMDVEEIAVELGITHQRVSQVVIAALEKLRDGIAQSDLEDYVQSTTLSWATPGGVDGNFWRKRFSGDLGNR